MRTAWVDLFNGPHVNFFQGIPPFLGAAGLDAVHFTARCYSPIPELVALHRLPATIVGEHGGKSASGKLLASTNRVLALIEHIEAFMKSGGVQLAVHKHSVEAARVAWGLGIPSVGFLDNEIMLGQNALVCPISNVVVTPACIDLNLLERFVPAHVQVVQYHGVSEVANVYGWRSDPAVLQTLGLDNRAPIAVIRGEPILASYDSGLSLSDAVIERLQSAVPEIQIVHFRRSGEGPSSFDTIDARTLFEFADLVISGGGTMTREAALMGANAISYFDRPLAVDRFLVERGLLQSYPGESVLNVDWRAQLRRKRKPVDLGMFEHPFSVLTEAVRYLKVVGNWKQDPRCATVPAKPELPEPAWLPPQQVPELVTAVAHSVARNANGHGNGNGHGNAEGARL